MASRSPTPSTSPSFSLSNGAYLSYQFLENHINYESTTSFVLGSIATFCSIRAHNRYFRRIRSAEWVTAKMIKKKRWVKGIVTSVNDGDGFRLYHTPGLFWRWPIRLRHVPSDPKQLKDETIHIRMAGVDAPESAHFGKVAQPYSAEALAWLKQEVEGRYLWVQIIKRDQYNRIVGIPVHPPRLPFLNPPAFRCVSISMLSAGYAITYEQSGAEYGVWGKQLFVKHELAARAAKRGMWASSVPLESPAEYKKRHRDMTPTSAESIDSEKSVPSVKRILKYVFSFWRKT